MMAWQNRAELRSLISTAIVFMIVSAGFLVLDMQRISTGDDLGYMFADTSLHLGDGKAVESLTDIISTQKNHYVTTNGRVLTHALVQLMLTAGSPWLFTLLNSVMFGLLWLLCCRLVTGHTHISAGSGLAIALALWLMLPHPGVIMLSLVAFSINYLWTAVMTLAFLLCASGYSGRRVKVRHAVRTVILAFLAGMMNESFSIPVVLSMSVMLLSGYWAPCRHRILIFVSYCCGMILTVAAPSNFSRVAAGGGFSHEALANKLAALCSDAFFSPIMLLLAVMIIWLAVDSSRLKCFCLENRFLLLTVVFSIALAMLSYTAVRQLFFPCVVSSVLLLRIASASGLPRLLNTPACTLFCLASLSGIIIRGYMLREEASVSWNALIDKVKSGERIVFIELPYAGDEDCPFSLRYRITANPMENGELKLLFDRYTKRGLSRLYFPGGNPAGLNTVVPGTRAALESSAAEAIWRGDTVLTSVFAGGRYRCISLPDTIDRECNITHDGKRVSFERLHSGNVMLYVLPQYCDKVVLRRKHKNRNHRS